jgi:hypothetical protein
MRATAQAIGPNFSHHQKTVMMDVDGELIAYVGGLDMTSGRYDDQSHPLFRQSTADDEADYYQYTIAKPEYGTYVVTTATWRLLVGAGVSFGLLLRARELLA